VTGADGRATTTYTAPPPPPPVEGGGEKGVLIVATPVGSNAQVDARQTAEIRLVAPGVILPPAGTPTPRFSYSPTPVALDVAAHFDASASCAGSAPCPDSSGIVSFGWSFGDGTTGGGRTTTHAFGSVGTFNVTLTVTNDRGVSASVTQPVSVTAGQAPGASFVFSPTPVAPGASVYFDASGSRPAAGRRIVEYRWNWGDGSPVASSASPIESHAFAAARDYTVVLTVVDDAGGQTSVDETVNVK
jgi:PKD repeat protein